MLTDYQLLGAVRKATGTMFVLRPYECLDEIRVKDGLIVIRVRCQQVRTTHNRTVIVRQGIRLYALRRNSDGVWKHEKPVTAWNDDNGPTKIIVEAGRVNTPDEARAQDEWEQICNRPGTARYPLDSYERTQDSLAKDSPKRMRKWWGVA